MLSDKVSRANGIVVSDIIDSSVRRHTVIDSTDDLIDSTL